MPGVFFSTRLRRIGKTLYGIMRYYTLTAFLMLKVASFDIKDADGINTLLSQYRLAQGAHILVSEGKVCIPYEDGEPLSNVQKALALKEQKNAHITNRELIEHSQKVLTKTIKTFVGQLDEAEANLAEGKKRKLDRTDINILTAQVDEIKNALAQSQSSYRQNDAELTRINLNIELFDQTIAELSA